MATRVSLTDPTLLPALEQQHRIRVEDYERMVEAGVFGEDDRLELLEGVIVEMSPQTPRHGLTITRLCDPEFVRLPPGYVIRPQLPLALGPDSEPEPDVAIVSRAEGTRRDRHPSAAALIFEVAGDSLRKDRLTKAALYAAAGIPEYVIVNLADDCLEVHRDPDAGGRRYRTVATLAPSDGFESTAVPGFAFAVSNLLS